MYIPVNFVAEDDPKELKFISASELRTYKKRLYILTNRPHIFSKELIEATDGIVADLTNFSSSDIAESAFYIYFSRGDFTLPHLKRIIKEGGIFASPALYRRVPFWENNHSCIEIYNNIAGLLQAQPKGSISEFAALMQAIEATRKLQGAYVEIGVFSGSSALAALLYMQCLGIRRTCWLLDTYRGFNYEGAKQSSDIKWYGTHTSWGKESFNGEDAIQRIKRLTKHTDQDVFPLEFNVCTDDFPHEIEHIAMANLDVDIYEGTIRGLQILAPRMIKGGIITTEDPTATHGLYGAYYALHEFIESEEGQNFICLRSDTTYFLIKK